ncbi:major facilitator superfamily domain-containing protein [Scleroderma citrinum]
MADVEKQSPSSNGLPCIESSSQCSSQSSCLQSIGPAPTVVSTKMKAWLTVVGSFLALFCSFGQMIAFGTYQDWYSSHQLSHLSGFQISWIGSLQLWVFFFMGGPIGWLFDMYGPSPLLVAGTAISLLSLVLTSFATHYYHYLLAQGILFGLSVAILFYPAVSSVATHFNEYRATAIGITTAGSGLGGVMYPVLLRYLFRAIGFGWAVRISALLSLVFGITAILAISTVPSQSEHQKKPSSLVDVRLTDKPYLLLVAGSFFVCLGIFIPYFYISGYTQSLHISPDTAFYVLSIMNAGGIVGRILPAWLSDKIGRFNLLCPSAFFSGLLCLVFWAFADNLAAVATFAGFYGLLSGAFVSVITPCIAQISDRPEMGMRIGALYTFVSLPALTGNPIAGALLQAHKGSFMITIIFSGSSMIIGSIFLLASRLSINRRIFDRV